MATPIALVLLDEPRLPDEKVLIETLRRRHPGMLWENSAAAANAEADSHLLIRAGDHLVAILLIPAAMPFNQQLWQHASFVWTEAFEAVGRHRAHLVVSMMGSAVEGTETAKLSVIESSRLLTAAVGALIEAQPGCLAVAWNGQVGRSPEEWTLSRPAPLIRFQIIPTASGPRLSISSAAERLEPSRSVSPHSSDGRSNSRWTGLTSAASRFALLTPCPT